MTPPTIRRSFPVPPETFAEMVNAESVGSYFAREVKARFRGERLSVPEEATAGDDGVS